jgi:hypothetical protein
VVTVRTAALELAGLRLVQPRPARVARTVTLVGRLERDPALGATVRAPTSGRFRLATAPGREVTRGDTLGWIESPETYPDSLPLTSPAAGEVVDLPEGGSGLVEAWSPVAFVASADTLRLVVPVPPDHYRHLRRGARLAVGPVDGGAAPPGRDGPGRATIVTRVTGWTSPGNGGGGVARVRARVPAGDGALQPGMRVPVTVEVDREVAGHWLPDPAVLYDRQRPDRTVVFVREDGGYRQVPVEVGRRTADSVFVTSGVAARDSVVAQGAYQLMYADFSFRGIGAEAGEMEEGEEEDGGP